MYYTTDISKYGVYEKRGAASYTSTTEADGSKTRSMEDEYILIASTTPGHQWYITDDTTAKNAFIGWLETNYPGTDYDIEYDGLPLYEITVTHNSERDNAWDCRAKFQFPDDSNNDEPEAETRPEVSLNDVHWSSTTRSSKIYQSIATSRGIYAPNLSSALNFRNQIGVIDGQTNGCDILVPDISGRLTVKYDTWTSSYITSLLSAVGCVNSATWGVFIAGSLLFTGADISFKTEQDEDGVDTQYMYLTISLKYRPDETINAPSDWGTQQTVYKTGWEYAWTHVRKEYVGGAQIDYPVQINVEQVYPTIDFNQLFILDWEA